MNEIPVSIDVKGETYFLRTVRVSGSCTNVTYYNPSLPERTTICYGIPLEEALFNWVVEKPESSSVGEDPQEETAGV